MNKKKNKIEFINEIIKSKNIDHGYIINFIKNNNIPYDENVNGIYFNLTNVSDSNIDILYKIISNIKNNNNNIEITLQKMKNICDKNENKKKIKVNKIEYSEIKIDFTPEELVLINNSLL